MPNHVLQIDCSGGITGLEAELDLAPYAGGYTTVWVEADVAFNSTYVTAFLAQGSSDEPLLLSEGFDNRFEEILIDPTGSGAWTTLGSSHFTFGGAPSGGPLAFSLVPLQFYRLKLRVTVGTPATAEAWIDGTSLGSLDMTGINISDLVFLDLQAGIIAEPGALAWFDNVIAGTTEGASDILSDDFEGVGAPSAAIWNSLVDATVIEDPGIAPPAGGSPPPPAPLTIRIYDLGTTVLADISPIALTKKLIKQAGTATSYVVTAPANHSLLTTLADDGLPNLDEGGDRKLVVWEDADPDTEDPIFHGRIYKPERTGDANSTQVAITAYDPRMELGYEADNRAGRIVRDSSATAFGDPSFLTPEFTSTVPDQDEISGPDLIQQILTYSQGDPTTNPVQGEGPLPIDLISGTWDLDVPPAIDLNPVDSADWPVLVGDLINQLVETDAVDFVLRPIRPGTGRNLDGDLDDYIMVEASAVSKAGADLTATVHFDYFTGDHNATAARAETDFSTVCDRLWYELGPRLNKRHWRGDITPHGALHPDLLPLMDDAADKYGGPDTFKGYLASFRIFDSLGTENSSRPLYEALYRAEVLWRLQPRFLLHVTPAPGEKALFTPPQDFDVYDLVRITTGPGFGVELDEAQRVYGYTKEWTREGVAKVSELQTSADVA